MNARAAHAMYADLGTEPFASRGISLPSFPGSLVHFLPLDLGSLATIPTGVSVTQGVTNHAAEAFYWAILAFVQVQIGQVQSSLHNGHNALVLAQESKDIWVSIIAMISLTFALLDAGAYEEALTLAQDAIARARTFPPTRVRRLVFTTLGSTYHALQQWEEARSVLAEIVARDNYDVPVLSHQCMHYGVAGEWEQSHQYAVQATTLRKGAKQALIVLDFHP